jgi:hypothetical protein
MAAPGTARPPPHDVSEYGGPPVAIALAFVGGVSGTAQRDRMGG